jgi:hypothetical protein
MDSTNPTLESITQFQNLDASAKADIQKVIEQESQKVALQQSIFRRSIELIRYP